MPSFAALSRACACCGDLLSHRFGRRALLGGLGAAGLAFALPQPAAANAGGYDAMLLTCIDPRFPEPTIAWTRQRGLAGKYSQFAIAGAAVGVVAPSFERWQPAFWDNLAASIQLHRIPKVIAIGHRDCGAAKIAFGAEKFRDRQSETAIHRDAMAQFRAQVAQRHPGLQVEAGLMDLDGSVEMFT